MKTKSGPSTKNLDSLEAAEKFFKFPETAVVGKYISNSFYLLTWYEAINRESLVPDGGVLIIFCYFAGFFDDEDSTLAKGFKKAADSLAEKYRFGHSTNADVIKKYGAEKWVASK